MTEEYKILPCPFCGCEAGLMKEYASAYVMCGSDKCQAEGPAYAQDHIDLAISGWNTRTPAIADGVGVEYVMVPKKATQAMRDAFYQNCELGDGGYIGGGDIGDFDAGYDALIKASTPPQAATDEG